MNGAQMHFVYVLIGASLIYFMVKRANSFTDSRRNTLYTSEKWLIAVGLLLVGFGIYSWRNGSTQESSTQAQQMEAVQVPSTPLSSRNNAARKPGPDVGPFSDGMWQNVDFMHSLTPPYCGQGPLDKVENGERIFCNNPNDCQANLGKDTPFTFDAAGPGVFTKIIWEGQRSFYQLKFTKISDNKVRQEFDRYLNENILDEKFMYAEYKRPQYEAYLKKTVVFMRCE